MLHTNISSNLQDANAVQDVPELDEHPEGVEVQHSELSIGFLHLKLDTESTFCLTIVIDTCHVLPAG